MPTDGGFREKCGVVGVFGHPEAANLAYLGLCALQHRGQEAAGGVTFVTESLMTSALDEVSTEYGLIAESVSHPADFASVTYLLRKEARWVPLLAPPFGPRARRPRPAQGQPHVIAHRPAPELRTRHAGDLAGGRGLDEVFDVR